MVLNLKAHPPTGIAYLPSRATGGADQISKWLDPGGCINDAGQNHKGISLCQVCAKRAQNAKYVQTPADRSPLKNIARTESQTGENPENDLRDLSLWEQDAAGSNPVSPMLQLPVPSWLLTL